MYEYAEVMLKGLRYFLTLINPGGIFSSIRKSRFLRNRSSGSPENNLRTWLCLGNPHFSATKFPTDLTPVCNLEFVCYGPVEKCLFRLDLLWQYDKPRFPNSEIETLNHFHWFLTKFPTKKSHFFQQGGDKKWLQVSFRHDCPQTDLMTHRPMVCKLNANIFLLTSPLSPSKMVNEIFFFISSSPVQLFTSSNLCQKNAFKQRLNTITAFWQLLFFH